MTFLELLDEYKIEYKQPGEHHHTHRGWVNLDCPNCSPRSDRFRLGFNKHGNYFSCWICGHLPLLKTTAEITGERFDRVKELLKGLAIPYEKRIRVRGKLSIPRGVGPILPIHRSYLKRRGFDPDHLANFWRVRGIGLASKLAWRIFIPVHRNGEVVSWTTRSLVNEGARYISAKPEEETIPLKETLYGEDHLRHSVIICEGPADVWKIGPGAVATYGVVVTDSQILRLSKYPIRIVCFDNEPSAQQRAARLQANLSCFPGTTHRVILNAKDPGEASNQEINELRKNYLD